MPKLCSAGICLALSLLVVTSALAQTPQAAQDDRGDALRRAAGAGDVAKVKELLDAGVDVNAANTYGGTALAFACDRGQTEVVNLLLERGADVNAKDRFYGATPLSWAVERGHVEIVRALLAKGATGEAEALASGAMSGQAGVVKLILERGKVNAEGLSNALVAATQGEQKEIVALLERPGPSRPRRPRWTPPCSRAMRVFTRAPSPRRSP